MFVIVRCSIVYNSGRNFGRFSILAERYSSISLAYLVLVASMLYEVALPGTLISSQVLELMICNGNWVFAFLEKELTE